MMMKRKISWLLCLLCASYTYGQDFNFETTVAPVEKAGYYKVVLSPELLGKLQNNKADLRVFKDDGIEQPYLIHNEPEIAVSSLFKEYKIIDKNYKSDAISHLIFHNPKKHVINNVSFIVKNTDVQKRARLSGSDDKKNWYVIKNNYLLHSMHSTETTSEMKILNFPLSDYTYFKLEINDNWRLPINIMKVGYYDTRVIDGASTIFDFPIAYQNDSLKTSYVKLKFPELKYLQTLHFEVSGAEYYSRYGNIYTKRERVNKKKEKETYFETISSFNLNSNSRNEVTINGQSVQELYVEINNNDDQPLVIEKATASYLNQYLVVKLEPDATYTLKFGNEQLARPVYDITTFANVILPGATKVYHNEIERIKPLEKATKKTPGIFENSYFIWSVIGLVGLILGLVSFKMIKEIGK